MGIGRAHDIQAIDGVRVGRAGERRALYGSTLATTHVPQDDLTGIRPTNHITRMKLAERNGSDGTLQKQLLTTPLIVALEFFFFT